MYPSSRHDLNRERTWQQMRSRQFTLSNGPTSGINSRRPQSDHLAAQANRGQRERMARLALRASTSVKSSQVKKDSSPSIFEERALALEVKIVFFNSGVDSRQASCDAKRAAGCSGDSSRVHGFVEQSSRFCLQRTTSQILFSYPSAKAALQTRKGSRSWSRKGTFHRQLLESNSSVDSRLRA